MEVTFKKKDTELYAHVAGELDTNTSPVFLDKVIVELTGVGHLILDLKDVEYCSSAGLRALLALQKKMKDMKGMTLMNPNEVLMDVFVTTGLDDVFNISK